MEKGGLGRSLLSAGVRPGTLIGFADEMRVGLRGLGRRVWGIRGRQVVQRLPLVYEVYEWKYLFLVVDFVRGRLEWAWLASMRSETVARALLGLRRHPPVRALVWDGARSHRSAWGRTVSGVKTVVQPAYSPELNPAERVFEEVRRGGEGRVYGRIAEKMEAVNAYLTKLESDPERVRSLTGWEWIRKNVQGLREDYAASSS